MKQEKIWDVDAARRYDTPGIGMFASEVVGPTVDRLVPLAGDGAALEFAIGTGRVAVPLRERGVLVSGIELSRPAMVFHHEPGYIGVNTYDVAHQRVVSHHFHFDEDGHTRLYRMPHRYIWPNELDLMAALAGFDLESRHADWVGSEFTTHSSSHVSVYRLPPMVL